jgi:hypothetical protein
VRFRTLRVHSRCISASSATAGAERRRTDSRADRLCENAFEIAL